MPSIDLSKLREVEDGVKRTLDSWSNLQLLIAYAYIHRGSNISMDNIDHKIVEEAKKQQQGGS